MKAMKKKDRKIGELPNYLVPYFWDVRFSELSIKDSSYFIINRLLEHGDEKAIRFLFKNYSRMEMVHVIKNSRSISKRSRHFWKIIFDIENEPCIQKQYPSPFGDY